MSYFEVRSAEIQAERETRPARPAPKEKMCPRDLPQGYVYFFKAGNHVKIGFSINPKDRMHSIQTGSPVRGIMVKFVPGTARTEQSFHKRFAEYRLKGEWFDLRGTLTKYLEHCVRPVPFPQPAERTEADIIL